MVSSCVCLSVCPSQVDRPIASKQLDKSSGFWHGCFFPCKETRFPPKIVALSRGTLSQLWTLKNFAATTAVVDRAVQKIRRQSSLLTTLMTVDASWLSTARPSNRNALTPFIQFSCRPICCAAVDKMPTDRAPRGPSAVAELFYYLLYFQGGSVLGKLFTQS